MPGFSRESRFPSLRRRKAVKGKKPTKLTQTPDSDLESVTFDTQELNHFDQPDMTLKPNGRPSNSHLDPYSIVDSPRQALTQYLHSSMMTRSKTVRASPSDGYPLSRVSGHQPQPQYQHQSFEKISGYHVRRPGSQFIGPSNWVNPQYQTPGGDVTNKPNSWPPREYTQEVPQRRRPIPQYKVKDCSPLSRGGYSTTQESQPKIVSPRFKRPMSTLTEARVDWVTAAQILEPSTSTAPIVAPNQALEPQLKRRVSNRSPDSGIAGVREAVKGKGKADNQRHSITPEENDHPTRPRKYRVWSAPLKVTNALFNNSEGQRKGSSSQSFDQARLPYSTSSSRDLQQDDQEIEQELLAQRRYKAILQRQEDLEEDITNKHLEKLMIASQQ